MKIKRFVNKTDETINKFLEDKDIVVSKISSYGYSGTTSRVHSGTDVVVIFYSSKSEIKEAVDEITKNLKFD